MSLTALVEKHALNAITALLLGLAFWRLGFSPELPAVFAFIFGGVLLAVIDWKVQRLPTRIVYYTLAAVGVGLLFASLVEWDWVPLATALAGAVLFANAFFLIWLVGQLAAVWAAKRDAAFVDVVRRHLRYPQHMVA